MTGDAGEQSRFTLTDEGAVAPGLGRRGHHRGRRRPCDHGRGDGGLATGQEAAAGPDRPRRGHHAGGTAPPDRGHVLGAYGRGRRGRGGQGPHGVQLPVRHPQQVLHERAGRAGLADRPCRRRRTHQPSGGGAGALPRPARRGRDRGGVGPRHQREDVHGGVSGHGCRGARARGVHTDARAEQQHGLADARRPGGVRPPARRGGARDRRRRRRPCDRRLLQAVHNPPYPTRFFPTAAEARAWLARGASPARGD